MAEDVRPPKEMPRDNSKESLKAAIKVTKEIMEKQLARGTLREEEREKVSLARAGHAEGQGTGRVIVGRMSGRLIRKNGNRPTSAQSRLGAYGVYANGNMCLGKRVQ